MSRRNSGGGCIYNVFNVGFMVVMFALPTVLLAYWYFFIRAPNGAQQQVVVVQQRETTHRSRSTDPVMGDRGQSKEPRKGMFDSIASSNIFSDSLNRQGEPNPDTADFDEPTKRHNITRTEHAARTWHDSSGKFSVQAKFYSLAGDQVKLITIENQEIEVPIGKLSEADLTYLRSLLKKKGIQASF